MLIKIICVFFVLASIIIFFTRKLAHTGKEFSELTGFSGGLIGFTLLAMITSMPEVAMSISSVLVVNDPNLCGGNLFGSNFFNLTIVAFVELFVSKGQFLSMLKPSTRKLIVLQILFALIPVIFIGLGKDYVFYHISLCSVIIIIVYYFFTRFFDFDDEDDNFSEKITSTLPKVIFRFVLYSSIIVIASIYITSICDDISEITGMGNSFIGALFLATVSSLPEITLSVSLIQINAYTMAIGNILGSNFFNILIFPITDMFMKESLYVNLFKSHIILFGFTAFSSIMLIIMIGKSKRFVLTVSGGLAASYFLGMYTLFIFTGR